MHNVGRVSEPRTDRDKKHKRTCRYWKTAFKLWIPKRAVDRLISVDMYSCDICGFQTKRQFNMQRHKNKVHGEETEEEGSSEMSEVESEDTDMNSEMSESDESSVKESDDDDEGTDPWNPLVQKMFERHQTSYEEKVNALMEQGCSEEDAKARAYQEMTSTYRKDLSNQYLWMMKWMRDMSYDRTHKKIKETVRRLRDDEEYEPLEAWNYAVEKRKFLLDGVLKDYDPPAIQDEDDNSY